MADPTRLDLLVIGAGTGNTILGPGFDGWSVGIVERDVFGGTCVNRGCIPTKMLVHTADLAADARDLARFGVDGSVHGARWPDVVDRVFGRIDPIAVDGEAYREGQDHVAVIRGDARFVDHKVIEVDGRRWTADQVVLAAGARPAVPDVEGLADVPFDTSDTLIRRPDLPEHLVVLGGGFIATELAHVFGSLGSRVTIVVRGAHMLRAEDHDVSDVVTEAYAERFDLVRRAEVVRAETTDGGGIGLHLDVAGEARVVEGDALLVAVGRVPNGDHLGVEATGIALDPYGYVPTDRYQRTEVDGIWALGDLTSPHQLKHLANAQAEVVAHNLTHPDDLRAMATTHVPHAVFGHPQVGAVGATEQELRARGVPYVAATRRYADVAYGWALEDTTGFCKVLADPDSRRLLGAHLVGPQASSLVQPLVLAMELGLTVDQVAHGQMWIHPALTEVVENALLDL